MDRSLVGVHCAVVALGISSFNSAARMYDGQEVESPRSVNEIVERVREKNTIKCSNQGRFKDLRQVYELPNAGLRETQGRFKEDSR